MSNAKIVDTWRSLNLDRALGGVDKVVPPRGVYQGDHVIRNGVFNVIPCGKPTLAPIEIHKRCLCTT